MNRGLVVWEVGLGLVEALIKLKYKQFKVHLACQHPRRQIHVGQPFKLIENSSLDLHVPVVNCENNNRMASTKSLCVFHFRK